MGRCCGCGLEQAPGELLGNFSCFTPEALSHIAVTVTLRHCQNRCSCLCSSSSF